MTHGITIFQVCVDVIGDDQPCNPFTEVLILQHHTDIVRHLLLLDDKRCVSAGDDGLAIIWDYQIWEVDTGMCIKDITEHGSSVKCLMLIGDDMFVSGGHTLHLWSQYGKLLHTHTQKGEEADVCIMMLTRHDRFVAAANKQLVVYQRKEIWRDEELSWQISYVRALKHHSEAIRALTLVSDILFASGSIDGTILLWSSQTFVPMVTLNSVKDYKGTNNFFPHSIQHLIVESERYVVAAIGCGFSLFDIKTKKLICQKPCAHFSKIMHLSFVCDGSFLATCSEDGSIRLWGARTYTPDTGQEERANLATGVVNQFLNISPEQLRSRQGQLLPEPVLLGECLAHSGVVQKVIDCGQEGMFTCGDDGLVIGWKNSELQKLKRNQLLQEQVLDPSGVV
ncbi:hypothetical protein FSP39_015128 [Pinctada imbricata]|uniref:Uncharacterized protein n=1 Tax=Pinctada imbricata TaxID=66713 RepID=A0AA89BVS4_PINIB|nr:hypothetical protein FSP39_015128 [Pinctada imbricata]